MQCFNVLFFTGKKKAGGKTKGKVLSWQEFNNQTSASGASVAPVEAQSSWADEMNLEEASSGKIILFALSRSNLE